MGVVRVVERYSKGERKIYELALSFVNQPMDVCNEQIERYVAYELYREAAKASGVAVVDANKKIGRAHV